MCLAVTGNNLLQADEGLRQPNSMHAFVKMQAGPERGYVTEQLCLAFIHSSFAAAPLSLKY